MRRAVLLALLALGVAALSASRSADASESHTQAIDAPNSLNAVSCVPAMTDCVVTDSKGNAFYSTNLSAIAAATWTAWSGPAGASPSEAVACPSSSLCVLADGDSAEGGGGNMYYATSLGGAWTEAFEPAYGVDAVSCVSKSLCVTGQAEGFIRYTTKPASKEWETPETEPIGSGTISAVDCLTSSFCAVVDSTGHVHVANTAKKISETAGWKSTDVDGSTALHGVGCTSTTSCLAVDGEGNVLDLTIDGAGVATVSKHDIDGTNDLTAIACTGLACVTVDSQGNVFLSADGGGSWTKRYETGTDLTSVSCSSNALCLAADTTGSVTAFASARASVEGCGGEGGMNQLGLGGHELCGVVNPHGAVVEACQFEVGTEANTYTNTFPCDAASLSGKEESVEVTAKPEGLQLSTVYYYRLSVTNKDGTESGPEEQFKTEPAPPSVISESVSVTEAYATLQAQIDPGGEASYYAEYGTSVCGASSCGTKTSGEGFLLGDTQEEGSLGLTNLKPHTTYHYWVVATNSAAPAGVHGEAKEFTTPKSWEEIRGEEDEQFFKQRVQEEAKAKAELEARAAAAAKEHQEEEAAAAVKKRQEEQASASKASVRIAKVKISSNNVVITLDTSRAGTVTLSGEGLETTAKKVAAATSQIKVMLTKAGKRDRQHHKKVKLTVQLKSDGKTVSESKTVKL